MKSSSKAAFAVSILVAAGQLIACSGSDDNNSASGVGGKATTGGSATTSSATGGKKSTGGRASTGGSSATVAATGGNVSTGGAFATGGALATGGATAVSSSTGGATSTGGLGSVTGGKTSTGGSGTVASSTTAGGAVTGGASGTGGTSSVAVGGTAASTGGTSSVGTATGGTSSASTTTTGGTSSTGGTAAAGGTTTAGGTGTEGGATATGGTTSTGGTSSTGGSSALPMSADLEILNEKNPLCAKCAREKCSEYLVDTYGTGLDSGDGLGSCFNTTVAALNQVQKVGTYNPANITPTPLVAGVATNGTTVCLDILSCVINTKCAADGVLSKCYCGDAVGPDCLDGSNYPPASYFASIGATTPAGYALDSSNIPPDGATTGPINGKCFIEEIDGRNNVGPSSIGGGFGYPIFALGPANQLVTCLLNNIESGDANGCGTCFQ